MYKVLEYFTDLKDNGYAYNVDDIYPREGYEPSAERIDELATDKNVRHRPLIELITASKAAVIEEEEKPKKRGKKKE